jgi:hypothetical protein
MTMKVDTREKFELLDDMGLYPLIELLLSVHLVNGISVSSVQLNLLNNSPREMIKLFHRDSACNCLKDLYYSLKDNTPKILQCMGCNMISDMKDIFECECTFVMYCTHECAEKDWQNHKSMCKVLRSSSLEYVSRDVFMRVLAQVRRADALF